ncbi:MAG: FecR family protein [Salinibacter sp.]
MDDSVPPDIQKLFEDASTERRREMASVWALFDAEGEARAEAFEADRTWAELEDQFDLGPDDACAVSDPEDDRPARHRRETQGRGRYRLRTLGFGALALTAALVLCAAGIWLWTRPVTVEASGGNRVTATLPDGSTVELNGRSRLSYRRGFGDFPFVELDERRVRLDGEAFFSVQPGSRPFVVETPNARVTALGTKFTVEAFGGTSSKMTQVTLRSGQVRFAPADRPERPVTLSRKGARSQLTGVSGAPTAPEQIDLSYAEAWRRGGFAVQDASLSVTLRRLERQFGTSIRLRAAPLESRPMTLLYAQDANLEEVLADICIVQGLSYRPTSQGYVLTNP